MNASLDHMLLFLETRVELCTVKNVCVERVVHRWGVRCDEIVSGILISRHSTCIFLKSVTTNLLWLLIHLQPPLLLPACVYTTQPVVSSNMMWWVQEDMKDSDLSSSVNLASCRVPAPFVSKKPIHQGFSQIPTWWESLSIQTLYSKYSESGCPFLVNKRFSVKFVHFIIFPTCLHLS